MAKKYYYKSNLRKLMDKYGISAKQLASYFNCSTSQAHHYMTGRSSLINGCRLEQLSKLFPEEQDIVKSIIEHVNPNFGKGK